jgi:hypothetical protein
LLPSTARPGHAAAINSVFDSTIPGCFRQRAQQRDGTAADRQRVGAAIENRSRFIKQERAEHERRGRAVTPCDVLHGYDDVACRIEVEHAARALGGGRTFRKFFASLSRLSTANDPTMQAWTDREGAARVVRIDGD